MAKDAKNSRRRAYEFGSLRLYLGGIWRPSPEGGQFSILTTAANDSMRPYHHRMPILLDTPSVRRYLADAQFAQNLLAETPFALRSEPAI